jgi:mRNA interferase MazF
VFRKAKIHPTQPNQLLPTGNQDRTTTGRRLNLQCRNMPSHGEVWLAFGAERCPVVILPSREETELRAIYVVPAAETDISGVAIELPVGRNEGISSGVVRVALARQDHINCSWQVSLQESDLNTQVGLLPEEKLSRLTEMLRLGGLE